MSKSIIVYWGNDVSPMRESIDQIFLLYQPERGPKREQQNIAYL